MLSVRKGEVPGFIGETSEGLGFWNRSDDMYGKYDDMPRQHAQGEGRRVLFGKHKFEQSKSKDSTGRVGECDVE